MYILPNNKAKLWINPEKIEQSAITQIYEMTNHPRLFNWVSIMPDVHAGIGATIGSVLPLKDAIIPAAVGVDIGCGMCCVKTSLFVDEVKGQFEEINKRIVNRIPRGFAHRTPSLKKDVHNYASPDIINRMRNYQKLDDVSIFCQLGTLGGGK